MTWLEAPPQIDLLITSITLITTLLRRRRTLSWVTIHLLKSYKTSKITRATYLISHLLIMREIEREDLTIAMVVIKLTSAHRVGIIVGHRLNNTLIDTILHHPQGISSNRTSVLNIQLTTEIKLRNSLMDIPNSSNNNKFNNRTHRWVDSTHQTTQLTTTDPSMTSPTLVTVTMRMKVKMTTTTVMTVTVVDLMPTTMTQIHKLLLNKMIMVLGFTLMLTVMEMEMMRMATMTIVRVHIKNREGWTLKATRIWCRSRQQDPISTKAATEE